MENENVGQLGCVQGCDQGHKIDVRPVTTYCSECGEVTEQMEIVCKEIKGVACLSCFMVRL